MTNLALAKTEKLEENPPAPQPSPAVQDYLRVLYKLSLRSPDGRVQTNHLANTLGVRPASVTGMMQKLAAGEPPLVDYHKYQGVRLSDAGQTEALAIVRRHRLIELYLHEKLGYSWDEVHEEADRLEHVLTDAVVARLAEVLDNPVTDPHGHLIPQADLSLETIRTLPLSQLPAHVSGEIGHVRDDDPAVLRALALLGLHPGIVVSVMANESSEDQMLITIANQTEPVEMDRRTAGQIFVRYEAG
jgi:DtxR family Mn-dependent transcriptional regulator